MITPKAISKMHLVLQKLQLDKVDAVAVMIAAGNVLITDITRKGELVIEHLKPSKNRR